MRKAKQFVIFLIFLISLFLILGPELWLEPGFPPGELGQNLLDLAVQNDVIIIFNSGGWGNTPLEQAEDFAPIIKGIQQTFQSWGCNSLVVPYIRTKDSFLGKISGTKDFLTSFEFSSEILAKKIEILSRDFPDKKIIITGLSSGAALVKATMKKISNEAKDSIYGIAVGTPFWHKNLESENILQLNNSGKDSLSTGEVKTLIFTLIKTPFKWISSKITGENLSFGQAIQAPGHKYPWFSPEVGSQIVTFLENKIYPVRE